VKIAIVGSGIAGLASAWLLAREHEITLFEADDRIGGHVHTHAIRDEASALAVDTGFIVFNERTYPNFCKLLRALDVAAQDSDMSFSVADARSGIEWNGTSLDTLFAQRRNLLRPSFLRMVAHVMRFNREATAYARSGDPDLPMRAFLARGRYGAEFIRLYLVPMAAAIWSMPEGAVLDFPFRTFATFFLNHGMLTVDDRPTWLAIRGGSKQYVDAIVKPFETRIRVNAPVARVTRHATHVELVANAGPERFDAVVLACHSDHALAMLGDASPQEREILGAIRYQANDTVLHTDAALLPRAKKAWASWNYHVDGEASPRARLTYWMNKLQTLRSPRTWCVTLNASERIEPAAIRARMTYHHPVMTAAADVARSRVAEIDGVRRTYFAGAYWGYGFHEDGLNSALRVGAHFGAKL
jgi:predicted NAD/FAD-binding protein